MLLGSHAQKKTTLCWGRVALDKVVTWKGPIQSGNVQRARVTFTYRIENLADWARNPQIQEAYGSVRENIDNAGTKQLQRIAVLTPSGWEIERGFMQ